MSEIIHVIGDLSGLGPFVSEWREQEIDKKAVGKLTKLLGPLQAPVVVGDALAAVEEIAGPGGKLAVDEAAGTLAVRAVVTDHQLHDLAAPLLGAFRLAGALGARGALVLVEGATDSPGFGHRLDVDGTGATVRALKKSELGAKFVHPAKAELDALEAALAAAPPPPPDAYPPAMREVPRGERAAYQAAWDLVLGADESTLRRAVAKAAEPPPGGSIDPALAKCAALATKADVVERLHLGDAGRVRGYLPIVLALASWIDAPEAATLSAKARALGTWPRYLCPTLPGLVASGDTAAEAEAWAIFAAASDDRTTEIGLWHGESAATCALSRSTVTTSTLIERLEASTLKQAQKPEAKRVLGFCLMLALRRDDPAAWPAIDRALAQTTGTLQACIDAYARERGWSPASA